MNIITLETDWLVLKKVKVNGIEALSIIRKKWRSQQTPALVSSENIEEARRLHYERLPFAL